MSVMNKPDYKIFAQDAKSGECVAFPDILRGWGITLEQYNGFPPMELFNSAANRLLSVQVSRKDGQIGNYVDFGIDEFPALSPDDIRIE